MLCHLTTDKTAASAHLAFRLQGPTQPRCSSCDFLYETKMSHSGPWLILFPVYELLVLRSSFSASPNSRVTPSAMLPWPLQVFTYLMGSCADLL